MVANPNLPHAHRQIKSDSSFLLILPRTWKSSQNRLYYPQVIGEQAQLDRIIPELDSSDWIAIDTEADSLHAYPEKLCLLQISCPKGDYLVDTLAGLNIHPLFEVFHRHDLIMHGADYDLRLFRKTYNFVPTSIFDTMTAGRLLGYQQFGLQALVERHLGIKLEKGPQKMNWAKRPLTPRMEQYAHNDTRYLKPLSDALKAELTTSGRLEWQRQTCLELIKDCSELPVVDHDNQWRIKGSDRLDPRGLAVLRELWKWREKEAVAANKPPFFVLNHDVMLELAHQADKAPQLGNLLPPRMSHRRKVEILNAIHQGRHLNPSDLPRRRSYTIYQPTMLEQRRFTVLREVRDKIAAELKIDPTLIASRTTLVLLSQDWAAFQERLMPWQRELLSPAVPLFPAPGPKPSAAPSPG